MRILVLIITICFNSLALFSQVLPPRIQQVLNVTATSFTVTWTPASVSTLPGTMFTYTVFVNGKAYNAGVANGLNIIGLTSSTTYTVTVSAYNIQTGNIPGGNSVIVKTLCAIPSTIDVSTDYTKQTNVSNITVQAESRIRFVNGFHFKAATNSRLVTKFSACPRSAFSELDLSVPEGDFVFVDESLSEQQNVEGSLSDNPIHLLDNIKLSPLPVRSSLAVSLGSGMERVKRLEVYNVAGQIVRQTPVTNEIEYLDLGNQPNGFYILRVIYKDDTIESKKFMLNK